MTLTRRRAYIKLYHAKTQIVADHGVFLDTPNRMAFDILTRAMARMKAEEMSLRVGAHTNLCKRCVALRTRILVRGSSVGGTA